MQNFGYEKKGITKATIGKGLILISDNSDISGLNRDITKTQIITKNTITSTLNFETGVDLRLFSQIGRKKISQELKTAPDNIIDNTWILSGGTKDATLTIAATPTEIIEAAVIGATIDGGIKEKATAAKVNVSNQYNSNIKQIKESFALRADIANKAGFLDSLSFLGQEIPIFGNFIPTASTGNLRGNLVIVDIGGIYNNKELAKAGFKTTSDMMNNSGILQPIIHVPYIEGTITEVALEMFAGYKVPGLQLANSTISNPNIKQGDTIILNSHSGGAIASSIGSNYIIVNNNGIIKQFANQSPAFGYFNNINSITKNYTFGDIVSTVGKILSPLYISAGEDKINLFRDNEISNKASLKWHYKQLDTIPSKID